MDKEITGVTLADSGTLRCATCQSYDLCSALKILGAENKARTGRMGCYRRDGYAPIKWVAAKKK